MVTLNTLSSKLLSLSYRFPTSPSPFSTLFINNNSNNSKTLSSSSSSNDNNNNNNKSKKQRSRKGKPSYGTSRRSILKKSFNQEQVNFTAPFSDDPVVAIIGGGISGLICALFLNNHGVRSTLFDSGVHGVGGRMGTRVIEPHPLIFDHAAQFFTVNDPRFAHLVHAWMDKGLVTEWHGTIGDLHNGGHFLPFLPSPPRYVATHGMRSIADSLLSQTHLVNVTRPCWISKIEPFNGMWHLSENGKPRGKFDAIVIAHNGKCANRLLMTSGLPSIAKQMKRLELSSIWALLAAFEDPLPLPGGTEFPFEGAFVRGVDSVSWMANNTKKLLSSQSGGPHCWTFFSTAAYGRQNKVPQENIPSATTARVTAGMLEGIEAALGLSEGSLPKPFYSRLQLW